MSAEFSTRDPLWRSIVEGTVFQTRRQCDRTEYGGRLEEFQHPKRHLQFRGIQRNTPGIICCHVTNHKGFSALPPHKSWEKPEHGRLRPHFVPWQKCRRSRCDLLRLRSLFPSSFRRCFFPFHSSLARLIPFRRRRRRRMYRGDGDEKSALIVENWLDFSQNATPPTQIPLYSQRQRDLRNKRLLVLVAVFSLVFLLFLSTRPSEFDDDDDVVATSSEAPTFAPSFPRAFHPLNKEEEEEFVLMDEIRGRNDTKLVVSHAFINSVYFYPTSKSLGDNAIAMTMAIDQRSHELANATFNLIGSNSTDQIRSVATSQTEGIHTCRYTTLMAKGNTVANLTRLEIESNGVKVEIPFKMARYTAPKPVIICISPQFVAEQWQMFLMHVHAAHRFGGHLHVYVTSMLESYFGLMREYESHGYMTLDWWLRMKFAHSATAYFEPNANVEWRNQAGAETDCLLQYKEAAEYVAFFDMDDILFPKSFPTYLQEFNAEWARAPDSNSIYYGRREHEFVKAETLDEFSFTELVDSLKSSKTVKRGKVVVRPDRYNSTWIHYSWHDNARHGISSPALVHVQRPIQKHGTNNMTEVWKMEFGPLNETIRAEDVQAIEEDIWRMRNLSRVAELAEQLPSTDFYLPIVFKCYYDAFYGTAFDHQKGSLGCPNADFCVLPQREEHKCVHSDAQYFSGPHMEPVTFHWSQTPTWSADIGCYQ